MSTSRLSGPKGDDGGHSIRVRARDLRLGGSRSATWRSRFLFLPALLWAGLPSIGAAASDAPSSSPVEVVVNEVGDDGNVFAPSAFTADVTVRARRSVKGILKAEILFIPPVKADTSEALRVQPVRDRTEALLRLAPGESRRLRLPLASRWGTWAGWRLTWQLLERDVELATGSCTGPAWPITWEGSPYRLRLTDVPGSGFRRSPSRAFVDPERYRSYAIVDVEADSLGSLDADQRWALLAALRMGRTTALNAWGPKPPSIPEMLPCLVAPASIVWSDGSGAEIRECSFGAASIRWFRSVSEAPEPSLRPEHVPSALAHVRGRLRPRVSAPAAQPQQDDSRPPTAPGWIARMRAAAPVQNAVALWGGLGLCLCLAWCLVVVRFARSANAPSSRATAGYLLALLLAPVILLALASAFRVPGRDAAVSLTLHDGVSDDAFRCSFVRRGGGGGTGEPWVGLDVTSGISWSMREGPYYWDDRRADTERRIEENGWLTLSPARFAPTSLRWVRASTLERASAEPPFMGNVTREGDTRQGKLTAAHDYRWVVALLGTRRQWLGPVAKGAYLDLAALRLTDSVSTFAPDEDARALAELAANVLPFWRRLVLVAEEPGMEGLSLFSSSTGPVVARRLHAVVLEPFLEQSETPGAVVDLAIPCELQGAGLRCLAPSALRRYFASGSYSYSPEPGYRTDVTREVVLGELSLSEVRRVSEKGSFEVFVTLSLVPKEKPSGSLLVVPFRFACGKLP